MKAARWVQAVFGGTVLAAVLLGSSAWALADGVRGGGGVTRVRPRRAEPQHPLALQKLEGCDELRTYYAEVIVELLVREHYGFRRGTNEDVPFSSPGGVGSGAGATSGFTGTNNQEAGVDEMDFVKTDGNYIYVLHEGALVIVRSWPPETAEIVSRLPISEERFCNLLLFGNRAAVLSPFWERCEFSAHCWLRGTRVDIIDLSDRKSPEVVRSFHIGAPLVGARMLDGHVFIVLDSAGVNIPAGALDLMSNPEIGLPDFNPEDPLAARYAAAGQAREILKPLVEAIIAERELTYLLPTLVDTWPVEHTDEPGLLLGCSDFYRTAEEAPSSILSVVHLNLGSDSPDDWSLDGSGIISSGWTLYASEHTLYAAQDSSWWTVAGSSVVVGDMATTIHQFELGASPDEPVRYVASGEVPGWLHNQYSMSEHNDHLRVATTFSDPLWSGNLDESERGNRVTVLENTGQGGLMEIGRLSDIAPGEQVTAAWFMGDIGYLVTYRHPSVQDDPAPNPFADPLFILDLSDPTDPRAVGELRMPGFSSYLHPLGDQHLVSLGRIPGENGGWGDMVINMFDVSQPELPRLVQQYVIAEGESCMSNALYDHRDFTLCHGVLSIPISFPFWHNWTGLIAYSIDPGDGIAELGRVDHEDMPGAGFFSIRRSICLEDALLSLSFRGLKINDLFDPGIEIGRVPFPEAWQPQP